MTKRTATKRKPPNRPTKAKSLAPRTKTADPEAGRGTITFLPQRQAGVYVNEDTAMTQSTVWACIRLIAETLAGLPWRTGRLQPDWTIEPITYPTLDWILNWDANEETRTFAFRETLWAWALGWGNGYAEIERNLLTGDPVALWQLHPSRVRPMRDDAGNLTYQVQNDRGPPTYLPPRNMFHLKNQSPDGLVGWSVIRMHARTIGLAMAQEESAATFNANDSTPGGVLEHPMKLSDPARKNLEESWNRRHKGPSNRRTVAILEEGMKWHQTGLPPDDAKLVEQMQLTPSMICRIFGVPPHMVAAAIPNSSSMYSNVEQNAITFADHTLRPWAERGESEADSKLFGRNNQAKLATFIDTDRIKQGDTAAKTQHVREMVTVGVWSPNEGRKYLGLQGFGPLGDKHYIQGAMIPLEDAGKQLEPPAPPEDSTDEPEAEAPTDEGEDDRLSRLQVGAMRLLTDACRRMIEREAAAEKQMGALPQAWLSKHREWSREAITQAASMMSDCFGANGQATEVAVSLFLDKHLTDRAERTPDDAALDLREYLLAAAAAKDSKPCQP